MSRERHRTQVMLTSLALVGVVAVGAAAAPSAATAVRADERGHLPAVSAVAVVEGADEGQGGSDELLAAVVVDVTMPRGVTPVAVDKAPTVLPPDPTQPYPAWDAWESYAAGDRVVHDGLVVEAVVTHRGSGDPHLIKDRAVWRIVSLV